MLSLAECTSSNATRSSQLGHVAQPKNAEFDATGRTDPAAPFQDRLEDWEKEAMKDKKSDSRMYRLRSKYRLMHFVDKNPHGDNANESDLANEECWEYRVIIRGVGWTVDSVVSASGDLSNTHGTDRQSYVVNDELLRMIRESPHNERRMQSEL